MAVKIRLSRFGRKNVALYRIVVADEESARDGKVLEVLGHYDPRKKETIFKVDKDKQDIPDLVQYIIDYDHKQVIYYFNMNNYEAPKAPLGMKCSAPFPGNP